MALQSPILTSRAPCNYKYIHNKQVLLRVTSHKEPIDCQQPIVVVSRKTGVCRVGSDANLVRLMHNKQVLSCVTSHREPIDCQQPIVVVSHKVGVCRVGPEGKPCKTWFNRLSYNGVSSVVKCTYTPVFFT